MNNPDRPVKLGIVGAGFFGQLAHIANYAQVRNCQMVALAAGRPELCRKVAQRYGISRVYATHRELLEDKEVEAIVAVTARPGTGPVALDCLNAGKSLLTEKPMASSVEQAEKLVEAARARKVVYSIGYMKRYDQGVQKAKTLLDELIQSEELGPVSYVRIHCFGGNSYCKADGHVVTDEKKTTSWATWPIAPDWVPNDQKQEYHQYLNTYCHNINLTRYLLESNPSVSHVEFDHPKFKTAILDFNGIKVLLETGDFSYGGWDETIEIYFAKGRLKIETPPALLRNVSARVEIYKGGDLPQTRLFYSDWSWAFRRQAEAFIKDVREGEESISSGADSLEDLRIVETMWRMKLKKQELAVHESLK